MTDKEANETNKASTNSGANKKVTLCHTKIKKLKPECLVPNMRQTVPSSIPTKRPFAVAYWRETVRVPHLLQRIYDETNAKNSRNFPLFKSRRHSSPLGGKEGKSLSGYARSTVRSPHNTPGIGRSEQAPKSIRPHYKIQNIFLSVRTLFFRFSLERVNKRGYRRS